MKNKILKISLFVILIFVFLLLISIVSNADTSQGSIIVKGSDIIYRVLPGTSVESFCNQIGVTLGDPDTSGDMPFTYTSYSLWDGNSKVTSGSIKTGMELHSGGSTAPKSIPISVIGDVTGDGLCNQIDLNLIIKHYIGFGDSILTAPEKLKSADINNDGSINNIDFSNLIRCIVTDNNNYLLTETEKEKLNVPITPEPQEYQLTLNLTCYETSSGLLYDNSIYYPVNPVNSTDYLENTIVVVDGVRYGLNGATKSTTQGLNTYEKSCNIMVTSGSVVSITTKDKDEVNWTVNDNNVLSASTISFKMPSRNCNISISNALFASADFSNHTSYTVDNTVRSITSSGIGFEDLTASKAFDLTLVYYSDMAHNIVLGDNASIAIGDLNTEVPELTNTDATTVTINDISYDLTNAEGEYKTIQGIMGTASYIKYTRTFKIYLQSNDVVRISTNNNGTATTWKYNDNTVKDAYNVMFNMPNSNAQLIISNHYDVTMNSDGLQHPSITINDSVRVINGTTGLSIR